MTRSDTLGVRLASLLDCSPDDVFSSVESLLEFVEGSRAEDVALRFEAGYLKDDRELWDLSRERATEALGASEKSPIESVAILESALRDIAAGRPGAE